MIIDVEGNEGKIIKGREEIITNYHKKMKSMKKLIHQDKKQFQKISLGNHADLCKLCRVDSQKVLNVFRNIALFRLYSSVGVY